MEICKTRLRHASLPFDSLPYPARTICRRVRTYLRTYASAGWVTWQPNEKRLPIFYEYGALSPLSSKQGGKKSEFIPIAVIYSLWIANWHSFLIFKTQSYWPHSVKAYQCRQSYNFEFILEFTKFCTNLFFLKCIKIAFEHGTANAIWKNTRVKENSKSLRIVASYPLTCLIYTWKYFPKTAS